MKLIHVLFLMFFFNVFELSSQTITLTYDGNGNRITKQINTNVPVAVIGGDSIVCKGNTAQLTASGGGTYVWGGGSTQATISVIADTTKTYIVVVTNGPGCKDTATKVLQVIPMVQITFIGGDSVVNKNQQVTYTVPYAANTFYDWSVINGTILSGFGTYQIIVIWDGNGAQGNVSVTAQVNGTNCQTFPQNKTIQVLPTGISEAGFQNLKIYPNPSQDMVNLSFETSEATPVAIKITNNIGVEFYFKQYLQSDNIYFLNFPRNNFGAAGIYTITLKTNKGIYSQNITITQ